MRQKHNPFLTQKHNQPKAKRWIQILDRYKLRLEQKGLNFSQKEHIRNKFIEFGKVAIKEVDALPNKNYEHKLVDKFQIARYYNLPNERKRIVDLARKRFYEIVNSTKEYDIRLSILCEIYDLIKEKQIEREIHTVFMSKYPENWLG